MLTKMEVLSSLRTPPAFDFNTDGTANSDKIQIRNIDGLGPVKATVNTTDYGSIDGAYFTGASSSTRNIVLTIGLAPDYSEYQMADLRQILYGYFMPKSEVTLIFSSSYLPDVYIDGYVESFDPSIFSQDPEIQVSIICPDPYFIGVNPVVATGAGDVMISGGVAIPGAQFTLTQIPYSGNVEQTDFVLDITRSATYSGGLYMFLKGGNTGYIGIQGGISLPATSKFELDTTQGNKFVGIVAGATKTSFMSTLFGTPIWPILSPGGNYLAVGGDMSGLVWTLTHYPKFGGL